MRQAGQGGHNTLNSSPQGSPLPLLYLDVYCRDALVKAPTGSGKTLAYLVPIIQVRGLPPMAGLRSRLDPFLPVFLPYPTPAFPVPLLPSPPPFRTCKDSPPRSRARRAPTPSSSCPPGSCASRSRTWRWVGAGDRRDRRVFRGERTRQWAGCRTVVRHGRGLRVLPSGQEGEGG